MLPKWHVLLGFLFAYILYWFTSITIFQASLIFLAAVFIDIDHYGWCAIKKKDWNLKIIYNYLKKYREIKKPLMLFHTLEFHILIALLGLIWSLFYYLLIGMIFHSITDFVDLIYTKRLSVREFWLTNALIKKYR